MIYLSDVATINEALNGIRVSLENGVRETDRFPSEEASAAYLAFEAARLPFSHSYQRSRREGGIRSAAGMIDRLEYDLSRLLDDGRFIGISDVVPYIRPLRRRDRPTAPDMDFIFEVRTRRASVYEFVRRLTDTIRGGVLEAPQQNLFPDEIPESSASIERLRRIVPAQKIAPVKFDIIGEKIVIK